jgi:cytoskeletal protein RodZ
MMQNNGTQVIDTEQGASPGATLRKLREQKGVSADTVRNQIGLTGNLFDALEKDQYDRLPAPVYVKGYLRCYAEALRVRPAPILASYQHYLECRERLENPPPAQGQSHVRPKMAMGVASALLLTTSLVFGAILTDDGSGSELVIQSEGALSTSVPAERLAPGDNLLHLEFVTDSWVEVVDSNDHILTVSLQRAGSTLSLEGVPPFKINLGYGPGVIVSYNNEPIALKYDPDTFAVDMTLGP